MKLIVDIRVKNLDRAVDFYTNQLDLTCRKKEKDWTAITVGDAEIHLYLHGGTTGHVEFYVEDIDRRVSDLKNRGVEFISGADAPQAIRVDENMITEFPWGRTAFFLDSEGNELAVVKDHN